jgi:pimeloyl-ACP methyl ester carboxylesterase
VIVPDLRGHGRSDKPKEVEAYAMESLAGDVLAVISAAGADQAHVEGHRDKRSAGWLALTAPLLPWGIRETHARSPLRRPTQPSRQLLALVARERSRRRKNNTTPANVAATPLARASDAFTRNTR